MDQTSLTFVLGEDGLQSLTFCLDQATGLYSTGARGFRLGAKMLYASSRRFGAVRAQEGPTGG